MATEREGDYDALQRHRFGRRSEQLDPDQFQLALEGAGRGRARQGEDEPGPCRSPLGRR